MSCGSGSDSGCGCADCAPESSSSFLQPVADPIRFRHQAIKTRLLERINSTEIEGGRPLGRLGTRDSDDPAIALLDAFAGSLHIVAWNTARLFDDGTLPRTQDRDALIDLTRLLGYAPRPAISATTTLAFSLDDLDTSPKVASIPKGMKIATVPKQGETPQTFETDAPLEALAQWNMLRPLRTPLIPVVDVNTDTVTVAGTATLVKPGDLVLVYLEPQQVPVRWLAARVVAVTRESGLDLSPGGNTDSTAQPPRTRLQLTSQILVSCPSSFQGPTFRNRVIVLGQRAAAFGATAPDLSLMSDSVRIAGGGGAGPPLPTEWKNLVMKPPHTVKGDMVDLDAIYPDAMGGRAVLFSSIDDPATAQMGRIGAVSEGARKGFGLSSKCSRITVTGIDLSATGFGKEVRQTAIHIETGREELLVADEDVALPAAATPDRITVKGNVALPPGRTVVLQGHSWPQPLAGGAKSAEVATLLSAKNAGQTTELVFEAPVTTRFHAADLVVWGNCVSASQGETPANGAEYIGSGNAAAERQRFALKAAPLAHVPAPGPRGYAPALEVRVGDRLFSEKPSIFALGTEDHAYMVRFRMGGAAEVQFAGHLPSGTHNVTALYRNGGGRAGNVGAGRLTSMLTPVIGVKGVTNLVPADGGSDRETIDDMRAGAPKSVRTFDRVVSLGDFEAFAEGYRGIGKALATELHLGMRQVVCLTVATTELLSPPPGSDIVSGLRAVLAAVAVPGRQIRVEGFVDRQASLVVALVLDPAFKRADVEASVRLALAGDFNRSLRRFGEPLHRSAVLASVQRVAGVLAARLDLFVSAGGPPEDAGRLLCLPPRMESGTFRPAELLTVDAQAVKLVEMQP